MSTYFVNEFSEKDPCLLKRIIGTLAEFKEKANHRLFGTLNSAKKRVIHITLTAVDTGGVVTRLASQKINQTLSVETLSD